MDGTPRKLDMPRDFMIAQHFNPFDAAAMNGWSEYISDGLRFVKKHLNDDDKSVQRTNHAILSACITTCENIGAMYNSESKNAKKAEEHLRKGML